MVRIVSKEIIIRRADVAEILDLRHRILRAGLPWETASFEGDDAATTLHFAAESDGKIVGCATIMLNEWQGEAAWQVRGMAVDESSRGTGIGRCLLDAIDAAGEVRLLWCNARTPAVDFYKRSGWQVVSEVFDIPTAGPHVKMIKQLPPLAR